MSATERELYALLKERGFELSRNNGHQVYKNPTGKIWVLPTSPSDEGWAENALHDLKNFLGMGTRGRNAVVGERREKRNHHEDQRPFLSSLSEPYLAQKATFQQQLTAIIPILFKGVYDTTSGRLTATLTPELEALKDKLSEMIFEGMTVKQIAEHSGGVDEALVRIVISRLFGKDIREIRKELQPVKPITTKELDYGKLELLIRAGYSLEKIAEKIGYSSVRLTALCKKYWDKTPQELRFEWAESTYEMLIRAKRIQEPTPQATPSPASETPATIAAAPREQFVDKEYPCARCPNMIRVSSEQQREMRVKHGKNATLPKLCRTCKGLIDGRFRRIFPNQLQEGDRVIECLGCDHHILFTRKQQDDLLMNGGVEPKFCRTCRSRSGDARKAQGLTGMRDIETHFMSVEQLQ
jgi:predicted RNA binding protein YcfA (HicA-like mRNA interferase family)